MKLFGSNWKQGPKSKLTQLNSKSQWTPRIHVLTETDQNDILYPDMDQIWNRPKIKILRTR